MISSFDKWRFGAIPGLLIHSSIGTVYCWSVLSGAVKDCMGGFSCEWAFSLAIFFLGISAAFLGPIVEKSVKTATLISASCFGLGMVIAGIACSIHDPILFHIGYGVIMGIGLGIGYISPIKTLMLWFKNNKGLAAGIAISGFGLAKVLGGPGFSYFIRHFGISEMFIFHGIFYFLIMMLAVVFIRKPKDDTHEISLNLTFKEWWSSIIGVFKLKKIWYYWLVFFLNITAGLAIISNEAVFFEYSGITMFGIGMAVSLCAIFNTLGRLGVSWFSDFLKNRGILFGMITVLSLLSCLIGFTSPGAVSGVVLLCNAGYGAMFAIMPSALHDRYGMDGVSRIHGVILSAWAFAGLTGNQLAHLTMITDTHHSPRLIIFLVASIYLVASYVSTKLWSSKTTNKIVKKGIKKR